DLALGPAAEAHRRLPAVGPRRDAHAQPLARVLVDEAPVGPRQAPALGLGEREHVHHAAVAAPDLPAAAAGRQPAAQAGQHRRLARARLADDAEHLARPEVEADVAAADPLAVVAREAPHAD